MYLQPSTRVRLLIHFLFPCASLYSSYPNFIKVTRRRMNAEKMILENKIPEPVSLRTFRSMGYKEECDGV